MERVTSLTSQKAVVIFSKNSCCMSTSIKSLFCELGVNASVHELDEHPKGKEIEKTLVKKLGCNPSVPVVFIGGELIGGANEVMSLHLDGSLNRMLRQHSALLQSLGLVHDTLMGTLIHNPTTSIEDGAIKIYGPGSDF